MTGARVLTIDTFVCTVPTGFRQGRARDARLGDADGKGGQQQGL